MTYSSYRIQRNRPMVVLNGKPIRVWSMSVSFDLEQGIEQGLHRAGIKTLKIDDVYFHNVGLSVGMRDSGRTIFYVDFTTPTEEPGQARPPR